MEKEKKYNYKYVIGLFIGLIVSVTGVYAATTYNANIVYYSNTNSSLVSDDVQGAIDELANKFTPLSSCPGNYLCIITVLTAGDYVSYTPSSTSFTTDGNMTGWSAETINPSELNLWRVLSINGDGTVDIISEYVSSVEVYFDEEIGYQNLVGYLNVLAAQYENSTYTCGSRHFGYNGQTEFITDTSKFRNPAPWTCSTGGSCSSAPVESQGGGDTLYTTDYNLVNTVLGTRVAKKVGTTTATDYWMASRYYYYASATYYSWNNRYVNWSGAAKDSYLYNYSSSGFDSYGRSFALRPIVTLKAGVIYSGSGTSSDPWVVGTS